MTKAAKLAPGAPAPAFSLPNTNPAAGAAAVSLKDALAGRKGCVVLWMCNHCPYVVGSADRITSLARETMAKGMGWVAVCSNDAENYPEDSAAKMSEYAKKWSLPFPYLRDESQDVARAYGVERTPEIFLLNAEGVCVYEGAFDDSPKDPAGVKDRPLKDGIEDLLAGRPVRRPQTAAIGCSVKWKK